MATYLCSRLELHAATVASTPLAWAGPLHLVTRACFFSVFETPSPFGVDRNAEFLPGPLDWDGKPGHLPTELPEVQPGVELPVWLQRYIAREQSESQGAQRAAL